MSTKDSSTSHQGLSLTHLKGALSPAEVSSAPVTKGSMPRGYFDLEVEHTQQQQQHRKLSKVSEMLHRTIDSPPASPMIRSMDSVFSSTDSLASLVERQQQNKIIHPSHQHQLFKSNGTSTSTRTSSLSLLNPFQARGKALSASSTSTSTTASRTPAMKYSMYRNPEAEDTRQLHPSHLNPHHVYSSPSVKESKKVSLGYDPVSRKKVLNSYEIIRELGRGEHGKVKLAKHLDTGELVAIKIVDRKAPKRSFKPQSSHEEKIRREIAIMKKINHPNVVQLKEVMDDENSRKIYLVLEYLENGEVKWQKSPGVPMMSLEESMRVFRDVVLGLEYLHYQGIIHRDIKPANLLIARDGAVKISDFGVSFASSLRTGETDDYDLAKTAGTPAFLAPELCQPLHDLEGDNHPKITYKIDIWALGVTLYCFLFGKLPFWANNEFELFDVICHDELKMPHVFPSDFTPEDKGNVRNFLSKILDKNPSRRLTIREIKQHPLTLKSLSLDDATTFIEGQKSCERKIHVSNEEVQVAVTGLGSRLRRGFVKALKFAGLGSQKSRASTPTQQLQVHSRYPLSSYLLNDDSSSRVPSSSQLSEKLSSDDTGAGHRRVKSGDAAALTQATVEGDLYLRTGSAFRSLNCIMDVDNRRSSAGSIGTHTVNSESYHTISTESSAGNGANLVSLPVNASFASLDSVYLDNYAPAYAYTSVVDARNPEHKEVMNRMNNFSLNQDSATCSQDEINVVAPHAKFDLDDGSDSDDEDTTETDDDDYDGNDHISELSIPSYLVHDVVTVAHQANVTASSQRHKVGEAKRGSSKYGVLYNSSDSDSEPEVIFANTSDEEEDDIGDTDSIMTTSKKLIPIPVPIVSIHDTDDELDHRLTESSASSGDELTMSFGPSRPRHNTITIASPQHKPNLRAPPHTTPTTGDIHLHEHDHHAHGHGYGHDHGHGHAGNKSAFSGRVSSPLAKNAPKTPIASSNAHLANEYVNHYHRVPPHLGHVVHEHHGDRGRSNSITVGILSHEKDEGFDR